MAKAKEANDPKKQITKIQPAANVPSYLQKYAGEADTSKTQMKDYRVVPRCKLIQAMSDQALKKQFGEGSAILQPGAACIASITRDESFMFVPVKFAPEFLTWSDREDNESPAIVGRSYDKAGNIAVLSRDPEKRFEGYGSKNTKGEYAFTRRHVEHLQFYGYLYSHQLGVQLVTLDFSKGEHGQGERFLNSLLLRPEPSWAQVYVIKPAFRDLGERKWWGWDYEPAALEIGGSTGRETPACIAADEVEFYQKSFEELTKLYEERRIMTDRSDGREGDTPDAAETKAAKNKF